jgi:hypothetical protein
MLSEAAVQQNVRLKASRQGARLFRNNNGGFYDGHPRCQCPHCLRQPKGRFIRYGLANESKRVNQSLKSSDLIGITPVVITADMVGQTLGVFTAIECKKEGWVEGRASGDQAAKEKAQRNFIDLVNSMGGIARFTEGGEK